MTNITQNKKMENILGGSAKIKENVNALIQRVSKCQYIDAKKQPVIYSLLKKLSDKEGITVEEYQRKMDT